MWTGIHSDTLCLMDRRNMLCFPHAQYAEEFLPTTTQEDTASNFGYMARVSFTAASSPCHSGSCQPPHLLIPASLTAR